MAAGTSPLRASHGGRLALAAAALVALWSAPAPAQDYDSIRPQINAAAAQQLMSKVTSAMRDPQVSDAGLKDIDDYFLKFFFPLMTSYRPEDLAILADNRQKLFRQFINIPRASPRAQKHLIDRTLAATRVIASGSKGNYHPAVRYNAVLILGMLDQQPGVTGPGGRPPVPMASATDDLLKLLEGEGIPSPVKVGALVGLERHTRFGVDAQYAPRIAAATLAIMTSDEPPADAADNVADWMRVQAVRVLVNLYARGGLTAEAHDALVKLVSTKEMGLDDRCEVAEALNRTLYEGAQGVDPATMAAALGQLAVDVLAAESRAARRYQDEALGTGAGLGGFGGGGFGGGGEFGGGGFGGGRGGYGGGEFGGGGGFDPSGVMQPQGPRYERRRFLDRVMAIYSGLQSVAAGGSAELKTRTADLAGPIKAAADLAANANTGDAQVTEAVVQLAREVNRVVEDWAEQDQPVAAAAADADGAAGEEFGE